MKTVTLETQVTTFAQILIYPMILPAPNVMSERSALLLRFREVPASNVGQEAGYPD
jgi:hypothetical protein